MRVLKGHAGKLRAVAYSPDGRLLATAGDAGVTKLWEVATGRELATIRPPTLRRVHDLAFSPDGALLTVAARRVHVWDVGTASEVPLPEGLGKGHHLRVTFTPD